MSEKRETMIQALERLGKGHDGCVLWEDGQPNNLDDEISGIKDEMARAAQSVDADKLGEAPEVVVERITGAEDLARALGRCDYCPDTKPSQCPFLSCDPTGAKATIYEITELDSQGYRKGMPECWVVVED